MAFKLKSGNKPRFKQMGSSPIKDMKTGSYSHSFEDSPMKSHKPGHEGKVKEVKGTSIFGKSPKEFVKSVGKRALDVVAPGARRVAKKAKKAYDKYKGKKVDPGVRKGKKMESMKQMSKDKMKPAMMESMKQMSKDKMKPAMMRKKEGKLARKSMKKVARPVKKKRTMTDKTKMKPPYARPSGPIAD